MTTQKKLLLGIILMVLVGIHFALFAAGSTWRTMGLALIGVDLFSIWFVFGMVREMKKLDRQKERK